MWTANALETLGVEGLEEYEPGRFAFEHEGLEFAVLATHEEFPWIRLHHKVIEPEGAMRSQALEFANALHGRSSTTGSHWWLGGRFLWQVASAWAGVFNAEVFAATLMAFIQVAHDRTPEIRSRLGGDWPS